MANPEDRLRTASQGLALESGRAAGLFAQHLESSQPNPS